MGVADDPRESYGRIGWDAYQGWRADQPRPWPMDHRVTWEETDDAYRELYERIGSAVAAQAVADAKARNERLELQLFAVGTAVPAARRALMIAITEACYEAEAKSFRRALEIFGGEDGPARPETALTDAEHALWEALRLGESMSQSADPVESECGRRLLTVLGMSGQERSDEKGGQLPLPESP